VEYAQAKAQGKPVLVHCWRGGMRSAAMSWLLNFSGVSASTLDGGYKSFRHWVLDIFEHPFDFHVVAGLTGSGKTEILKALEAQGEQVLDLEALANHRGSAFGGLGMAPQPTNEQFENEIAVRLNAFDITRPVWIEDESRLVGRLQTPKSLFENKEESPIFVVWQSKHNRIARLVNDYGAFPHDELASKVEKLREQLGGERTSAALQALKTGNLAFVASLMLEHYDKKYLAALQRKAKHIVIQLNAEDLSVDEIASALIEAAKQRNQELI
jgi:tRNA 2-selenouridine synthase